MSSCRASLWTKQHPRRRNLAWSTKTKDIMPRRDFGPLSTNHNNVSSNHNNLSTYHNNLSSYHNNNPNHIEEQGHTDAVKLQGKLPCGQHEGNILHHNQSAKEGCQRKVLPSPDGQRLWLVLGTPLTAVH